MSMMIASGTKKAQASLACAFFVPDDVECYLTLSCMGAQYSPMADIQFG